MPWAPSFAGDNAPTYRTIAIEIRPVAGEVGFMIRAMLVAPPRALRHKCDAIGGLKFDCGFVLFPNAGFSREFEIGWTLSTLEDVVRLLPSKDFGRFHDVPPFR